MERYNRDLVLCSRCNNYKSIDNFKYLKKKWFICITCNNERRRKLYLENPNKYKGYKNKYYQNNKDKCLEKAKIYRENNFEKVSETQRNYRKRNPHRKSIRIKKDLNFRLRCNLATRIYHAIKGTSKKSEKTMALIGCSIDDLKLHLESKFMEGMCWDNYGKWHIDHIKPCSLFNLTFEDEQKLCFNYKNLQPLWALDNLKKNNKYEITTNITL